MRSEAPPLLPIFRSRHQAELLAWLLLHPDQEFGLTELAQRLDVPLTTLQREAQRLIEADLLQARTQGRNRLVRANPANRATAPLRQLLEPSLGPLAVIGEELALPRVECVVIFGFWADRYQGQPGPPPNDIDVLVIGDPLRAEVYDAADRAQTRLGLPINPILRTSEQWATNNDPLVEQVRHSPNVAVFEANGEQA